MTQQVFQIAAGYEDCNEYCYMPLHIYEGLSGKLITTILKPGRRNKQAYVAWVKEMKTKIKIEMPHFCISKNEQVKGFEMLMLIRT